MFLYMEDWLTVSDFRKTSDLDSGPGEGVAGLPLLERVGAPRRLRVGVDVLLLVRRGWRRRWRLLCGGGRPVCCSSAVGRGCHLELLRENFPTAADVGARIVDVKFGGFDEELSGRRSLLEISLSHFFSTMLIGHSELLNASNVSIDYHSSSSAISDSERHCSKSTTC